MREIGSEFWNVPTTEQKNKLFPESTQWFLSGRNALTAIIRDIKSKKKVHTVAMPSWCCDSMIIPFLREGIDVRFYQVYWKDSLIQEIQFDSDVLFLMDYFGYTMPTADLAECIVIRDVTHSLLSHQYTDAQYYFGSLRKWCGVKTGGYAWGERLDEGEADEKYATLRSSAMQEKAKYINGEIEDKEYLKTYEKAETYLDGLNGVYCPLKSDVNAARHLAAGYVWTQRRKNARVLMSALKPHLIFPTFLKEDCPMFVPILVPNGKRNELRRYLIKHEIYCPIHWPVSEHHRLNEKELYIYQNELSLVCDQRYTEDDMNRIIETIEKFWKEGNCCSRF